MAPFKLGRLRRNQKIRDLVSQVQISVKDLIMPYFVVEGRGKQKPIASMPGINRLSVDSLIREIKEIKSLGIKAILLFGVSEKKDKYASFAFHKDGVVQKAIRGIKRKFPDLVVMTDVCLCGHTVHGHCGIIKNAHLDDDATLEILAKIALSHAEAGADFVAPSAMMDGQVEAIREALENRGFPDVGILAYSAKYASNFYGPFREALGSSPKFGDRKSYQLDYRNSDEALREIRQDITEGADIVMVKPALAYLDIIRRAKENFNLPVAAYNVSGEYSLVKVGARKKIVDEKGVIFEILTAIKRAGADLIITYHSKEVAKWLRN